MNSNRPGTSASKAIKRSNKIEKNLLFAVDNSISCNYPEEQMCEVSDFVRSCAYECEGILNDDNLFPKHPSENIGLLLNGIKASLSECQIFLDKSWERIAELESSQYSKFASRDEKYRDKNGSCRELAKVDEPIAWPQIQGITLEDDITLAEIKDAANFHYAETCALNSFLGSRAHLEVKDFELNLETFKDDGLPLAEVCNLLHKPGKKSQQVECVYLALFKDQFKHFVIEDYELDMAYFSSSAIGPDNLLCIQQDDPSIDLEGLQAVLTQNIDCSFECRDEEIAQITNIVNRAVSTDATSQVVYVSGVPGTGKTAITKSVIASFVPNSDFIEVYVNAMNLLDPKHVFVEIIRQITKYEKPLASREALLLLNNFFRKRLPSDKPVILVIDELDQIICQNDEMIHNILNWADAEHSKLCIIGIGISLDFPERNLTRKVASRMGKHRVIFQPYQFWELECILHAKTCKFLSVVDCDAIQLIAKRVASISGDFRKAADALALSVRIALTEQSSSLTTDHVVKAHKELSKNILGLFVNNLSKHELFLFRAAVQLSRHAKGEDFSFATLFNEYWMICTTDGMTPWHDLGIHSLVMKMAVNHLFIAGPGKNMMLRRIRLGMLLGEAEVSLKRRDKEI